jgi:aminoglycoside 2'-N-acetyltransferase I
MSDTPASPAGRAVQLRVCDTDALTSLELAAIRAPCDLAFVGEYGDDDFDHALGGLHVIAFDGDQMISHAALVPRDLIAGSVLLHVGYVESVVTDQRWQGHGHGTAVMRRVGELVAERFHLGVLSTGEHDFYSHVGWQSWEGPTFVDHGANGRERTADDDDSIMILRHPASPAVTTTDALVCTPRQGDNW